MATASDNKFPKLILTEQGSTPASPAAGDQKLFIRTSDHKLCMVNSAGAVVVLGNLGDVVGPASAIDNQLVLFDSITGKLIKAGGLYASGTYTPTLTNSTNVAASTAYLCMYTRLGNIVTVSGKVSIDPTATGATILGISLPIASNLANDFECAGVGANSAGDWPARISGDTTNDRANLVFVAVGTANQPWWFTFSYQVL